MAKKLLFVHTRKPHGSIVAQEALDALLMGSAFAECEALFLDDGVYQLLRGQDPSALGQKDFARTFGALADYGVSDIYCSADDLAARGLDVQDLVIDVQPVPDDVILNF